MPRRKSFFKFFLLFIAIYIFAESSFGIFERYYHVPSAAETVSDFNLVYTLFTLSDIPIYIMDKNLLSFVGNPMPGVGLPFLHKKLIFLGIDARYLSTLRLKMFHQFLEQYNFQLIQFSSNDLPLYSNNFKLDNPVALIMKRYVVFYIIILQTREDNTWWFGSIMKDINVEDKLNTLGIEKKDILLTNDGILNKFETAFDNVPLIGIKGLLPRNIPRFLGNLLETNFIECNMSRKKEFQKTFITDLSPKAQRFKHKAWKVLAKAKSVLDKMSLKFWLSSGTCLGYLRECDIIAHSLDVDIGIFAKDYNRRIITQMEKHGFTIKNWFGLPSDSLEISFIDQTGIKLDIFFFYEDSKNYWNGATQAKSGLKYKYIFPKFKLCWTIFLDLKVRVPCNTESYIRANYGPNWFIPIKTWDWKNSPYNVHPNGLWPKEMWSEVIKIY